MVSTTGEALIVNRLFRGVSRLSSNRLPSSGEKRQEEKRSDVTNVCKPIVRESFVLHS